MKVTPPLGDYRRPVRVAEEDLKVATPQQVYEAWSYGVMHGEWSGQDDDTRRHPWLIDDPIYRRDDEGDDANGWHSASNIQNAGAQVGLAGYLRARGLKVPEHTQASWDESNRRAKARQAVIDEVHREMVRTEENADQPGHPTMEDYAADVARRLNALLEDAL